MSSDGRRLAPGDYVFLSFLTVGPMSPYDVKTSMARSVSNFWTAAHSQVYQQAARLVRDGYVREREAGGARRKRLLSLTPKGRREVLAWLRAPAQPARVYSELLVKVFFAPQAEDLAATRAILEDHRLEVAERLAGYERLMEDLSQRAEMRFPAMTLDFGIRYERALLEWLDDTLAELDPEARATAGR